MRDGVAPLIQNNDNNLDMEQEKQHLKEDNGFDLYFQSLGNENAFAA